MKKQIKKLALSKDTLHRLNNSTLAEERELGKAVGGYTGTCYKLSYCTCTNTRYC